MPSGHISGGAASCGPDEAPDDISSQEKSRMIRRTPMVMILMLDLQEVKMLDSKIIYATLV